jgi:hypothetical protein
MAQTKEEKLAHNRELYKQRLAMMTPEQLNDYKRKNDANWDRWRNKQSEEKQKDIRKKENDHKRKKWHDMIPEQRDCELKRLNKIYRKLTSEERKQRREKNRAYFQRLRMKVLSHYSNGEPKCANPLCEVPGGAKDILSLQLDHVNGGGRKHLKRIGVHFYPWIIKNNYPSGFQILCANCNNKKRITNKENNHLETNDPKKIMYLEQRRKINQTRKCKVLNHYSHGEMRCMNPNCEVPGGVKDLDSLTVDHIHGGGKKHLKILYSLGTNLYAWLIHENMPDGYQILCWNCNIRKRTLNKEGWKKE